VRVKNLKVYEHTFQIEISRGNPQTKDNDATNNGVFFSNFAQSAHGSCKIQFRSEVGSNIVNAVDRLTVQVEGLHDATTDNLLKLLAVQTGVSE
jgi:hypothetical protein